MNIAQPSRSRSTEKGNGVCLIFLKVFPCEHPVLQLLTGKMFHSTSSQTAMPLLCDMGGPGDHSFQAGSKTLQVGCEAGDYSVVKYVKICQNTHAWFRTAEKGVELVTIAMYKWTHRCCRIYQDIICLQPVDASMFARKSPSNPPTT